MALGWIELMTELVVVARLSHESQNALENMYWGHMTQHVTHTSLSRQSVSITMDT